MFSDSSIGGSVGKHSLLSDVKGSEIAPFAGGLPSFGELQSHRQNNSVDLFFIQAVIPPQMTTKMKSLLKGLRYISQIFEQNEKEREMQIGFPTDVKHVAHIGWDGPTVNSPSWMNEFRPVPESSPQRTTRENKEQISPTKKTSHGSRRSSSGTHDSPSRDLPELPKPSRRHQTQDSPNDAQSNAPKTSRRHQSSSVSTNSATGEASNAPRQPRRNSHKLSSSELDSPTKESSGATKQARRKKSNRSEDGGSTRSSRSKAQNAAYSDPGMKNTEEQLPALKPKAEEI